MSLFRSFVLLTVALVIVVPLAAVAEDGPVFEERVHQLLKTYCWKCHGGEARQAELDTRSLPLLLKGGKHGAAIVPGNAGQSLLYQKLVSGKMPPGKELRPTDAHIRLIREWIDGGARARYQKRPLNAAEDPALADNAREWWSFQPPVRPPVPGAREIARARTPVDAFVISRLESSGLSLAAPAERQALARRIHLDVLGLPPSPGELRAFLADTAPGAWVRLVDRLLGSPHFGERWGRHWLDAAGYVDTIGSDNDAGIIKPSPGIWRYRDYCIEAINADKRFDEFLVEQLAGDELVNWREAEDYSPGMLQKLIATGFLRQARDVTYAPELNTADIRHQVLFDTLQTVSSCLLGLTIHCAQTTDHQQITRLGHQAPVDPQVTSDETYGNRILHFETHSGPKNSLGFQVSWRVTRREVRAIDAPGDPVALSERHKTLFLEANSRVPISGKPLELIEETRLPDSDPLALGRVFYDRVNDHMKYDKSRPGYGNGDVLWACDSRFGNCTDFHSLFISLARSQGLPAKFEIGFPLPPQRGEGQIGGYHCWAQFYIDGHGWVPTDISEADKDPRRESYYYGNLTENRVQFTTGRDIVLVPPQSGKPLNYFIYPHVEVNGQPWPTGKTRRRFTYKDLET